MPVVHFRASFIQKALVRTRMAIFALDPGLLYNLVPESESRYNKSLPDIYSQ